MPVAAQALEMPSVFGDGMVLQRGQAVPIWGKAEAGSRVTVEFAGQTKATVSDAEGAWRVDLDTLDASAEARVFHVSSIEGKEQASLQFADVVVGEVWLCGGQSNMYRPFRMMVGPAADPAHEPMAEYLRKEAASANDKLLRQYRVSPDYSPLRPEWKGRGTWTKAVSGDVNEFSTTAYFFGRELRNELDVPVGLLSCNLGGTRIEPWIAPEAFAKDLKLLDYYDAQVAAYQTRLAEWDDAREEAAHARSMADWEKAQADGKRTDPPRKPPHPSRDKEVAGTLYNGMVRPLAPYAIKGAIWYQGESNSGHFPEAYGDRLVALVESWRAAWGQKQLYFFWCQLANYRPASETPSGDEDGWALVQNGQRYAMRLPDTGMAVLNDVGDSRDVHPKNKMDAGKRLSLWALARAYGRDIVFSGPLFRDARVDGDKVILTFDHVGSGLMVGRKHLAEPTVEVAEPLKRLQVCGADRVWKWAEARIVGDDTIVVSHAEVPRPVEVRYAWSANPAGANIYNKEGLPASIFNTGDLRRPSDP